MISRHCITCQTVFALHDDRREHALHSPRSLVLTVVPSQILPSARAPPDGCCSRTRSVAHAIANSPSKRLARSRADTSGDAVCGEWPRIRRKLAFAVINALRLRLTIKQIGYEPCVSSVARASHVHKRKAKSMHFTIHECRGAGARCGNIGTARRSAPARHCSRDHVAAQSGVSMLPRSAEGT